MDDHQFKEDEVGSVEELSTVCSRIVLKCLFLVRIGRPDIILWSVNKFARAVTKWKEACDKRSARLISYIHLNTGNIVMWETQHHNADKDCFKNLNLQETWKTQNRPREFVSISWMCKKQTLVSHSSTEAEVISLDASFMHGQNSQSRSLGFID